MSAVTGSPPVQLSGSKQARVESQSQPPSNAIPLQKMALSVRMTHAVFVNTCVPHLTVKPERGYKFGDYSCVLVSHKSGLTPQDRAKALKEHMESSGKATFKEIKEWESITKKPFASTKITDLDVSASEITDTELEMLIRLMPNLTRIDATDCSGITEKGFKSIAKCRKLQSLNVTNCAKMNDAALQLILLSCGELQNLEATQTSVTDEGFKDIGKRCPKLQKLVINNPYLTDTGLEYIGGCKELITLNIFNCDAMTDGGLLNIIIGCPKLQVLDISCSESITNVSLQNIGEGCKDLRSLRMAYCHITDEGLQHLSKCSKLQELDISSCPGITDVGLIPIAKGCKGLERLCVDFCQEVTDASLQNLGEHCPELQDLSLMGCNKVTNSGLQGLGRGCHKLIKLCSHSCRKIKATGLQYLAEGCPMLKDLDVSFTGVTPIGLQQMGDRFKAPINITIASNPGIVNVDGLDPITASFPNITFTVE